MNSKIRKLLCAITVGCIFLLLNGTILASDLKTPSYSPGPLDKNQQLNFSLNKLTADGTITQQQADKVRQFFKDHTDIIHDLVKYAGLSENQAKAVADSLCPPGPPPGREQHLINSLNKLVADGTITQPQADKVRQFLKQKDKEHQADFAKMPDRDAPPPNPPDIIRDLVKYAGLSENQAIAVADAIRPPGLPPDRGQHCPPNNSSNNT